MAVIEEEEDKSNENLAQLQIMPSAAGQSQNDTTTKVDHSQQRKMNENNVNNPMDLIVQEDDSNTSFSTEQHSGAAASLHKCLKKTNESRLPPN